MAAVIQSRPNGFIQAVGTNPAGFDGEDGNREPLPPGHPTSWKLLTDGTILDGADYPFPVFSL